MCGFMKKWRNRRRDRRIRSDVESSIPLNSIPVPDAPFGREALERNAPVDGVSNYSSSGTQTASPIITPAIHVTSPGQGSTTRIIRCQHLRTSVGGPLSSNPTYPLAPGLVRAIERSKRHVKRPEESMADYEARLHREISARPNDQNGEGSQPQANHNQVYVPRTSGSNEGFQAANYGDDYSTCYGEHRNNLAGRLPSQAYNSGAPRFDSQLLSTTVDGVTDDIASLNLTANLDGNDSSSVDHSVLLPGSNLENLSSSNLSYSVGDDAENFVVRRLSGSDLVSEIGGGSSMHSALNHQSHEDTHDDSLYSRTLDTDNCDSSERYNSDLSAFQQAHLDEEFSMEDYEREDSEEGSYLDSDSISLKSDTQVSLLVEDPTAGYETNEDGIDSFETGMHEATDSSASHATGGSSMEYTDNTQANACSSMNSISTGDSAFHQILATPRGIDDFERGVRGERMVSLAEACKYINGWLATKYPSAPSEIQELSHSGDPEKRLESLLVFQFVLKYCLVEHRQTSDGKVYTPTPDCKEVTDSIRHRIFVAVRNMENGSRSSVYDDPIWMSIEKRLREVHQRYGEAWVEEKPEILSELFRVGF